MSKPIVIDHGVYTRDNPYGYIFNVNHPIIKKIYERYKERRGLSSSYPVSDAERRRFDWYIGKLINEGSAGGERHYMSQRTVSKQEYKEIVKKYNSLCGAHQLWELWQDSMTMYALAISNAVDGRFREQREKAYADIAHKYTKEEMQVFPQILGEIVTQLEVNPEQDLLGDLYMQLDLGSHWHGQFFTPYNICAMIAHTQLGQQGYTLENVEPITVCDCACGGGALLIAAAHEFQKAIKHTGLNAQNYICLYAQDLSQVSAMMCYVQLSLQGFAAKIKLGDTLRYPLTDSDNDSDIWYTPMWFSDVWQIRRMIGGIKKIEGRSN